jgi:hypothetical protein
MNRQLITITGIVLGLVLAGAGTAASGGTVSKDARIVIRHQLRGCHTWSVNGGPFRASQRLQIMRGGTITFVNNDVMPHKLVETSGPAVRRSGNATMRHVGASVEILFSKRGLYRFTTKAGEDYMPGVKTIGEDNVLRLNVTVR